MMGHPLGFLFATLIAVIIIHFLGGFFSPLKSLTGF